MQIEADILTAAMVKVFFGEGIWENANEYERSVSRTAVMGAYLAACEGQHRKDEADERARTCENLRIEIDYVRSILVAVQKNPINSDSVNLMIASLPCERLFASNSDCLPNLLYTTNATHASDFVTRLLETKDMGHFHHTFNSLRANPYISGPDAVLLLTVGLQMYAVKLTRRREGFKAKIG